LAIPLVVAIATAVSARAGILVKDRLALERMRTVDTVVFDKTGTLTQGSHVVTAVAAADGTTETEVRWLAAGVESDSEHPLAWAIVDAAGQQGDMAVATWSRSLTGRGVEATIDGVHTRWPAPRCCANAASTPRRRCTGRSASGDRKGASVLHLVRNGEMIGALALEDAIRPEAQEAVEDLKRSEVEVPLITGDAPQVAETVAAELGIDEVFAEVLPEDKEKAVANLQDRGLSVAMVGDGVNDAPALARADVGTAIGAGTDVAIESAGVVLASSDPRGVTAVRRLSVHTYRKMVQNLGWAAGYNIIAIPLAAGALAWAGVSLPPYLAAPLMSASTIVVALNAQLLRRVDLHAGGKAQGVAPDDLPPR
jgi:Cu2+-exporting ATPase